MPALTTQMDRHDPSDLSSFNHRLSNLFSNLTSDSASVLSLTWTRRLLDSFLISLEEFRFILQNAGPGLSRPPTDRLITDFFDRAVKSLDLCTAVRDGIERVRNWQKHVHIIIGSLTGPDPLGEGPVRRARKAIGDLAIMMLDERDLPGSGSGSGFRNRSFARGSHHKDHHHGHGHGHSHGHGTGPHHRRSSSGGGGSGSSSNGHFRYRFNWRGGMPCLALLCLANFFILCWMLGIRIGWSLNSGLCDVSRSPVCPQLF